MRIYRQHVLQKKIYRQHAKDDQKLLVKIFIRPSVHRDIDHALSSMTIFASFSP